MLTESPEDRTARSRPSRPAIGASAGRPAFTCLRVPFAGSSQGFEDANRSGTDEREFVLYRPVGAAGLPIAVERCGGRAEVLLPQIRL